MTAPADGDVAIIGSGPAAIACAWQLVARGIRPVILDAGEVPPPQTAALVQQLRDTHGAWAPALVEAVTRNPTARGGALPKKLVFGSDYVHGNDRVHSPLANTAFVAPTFARGGYTVAWGGAMLPMDPVDMQAWPVVARDLQPGIREVLRRLPVSGQDDGLSRPFPMPGADFRPLPLSLQARRVATRLAALEAPGEFASGQARLAVSAPLCRACGLCLSGCAFGAIHSFDQPLASLVRDGLVDYRPGVVVTRLSDAPDGVRVDAVDASGAALPRMGFGKVFLAAGAINSARIALESADAFDTELTMLDSQKFAVPLLVTGGRAGADAGTMTLPSLFVDHLQDGHWVHLQVSPFSHYAQLAMEQKLAFGPLRLGALARSFTGHMMVGWGGLHSDLSDRFALRLLRAHSRGRPVLRLQPLETAATRAHARRALRGLARRLRQAGVFVPPVGTVIGPPGAGFHFGGTLAMRERPVERFDTDALGRLAQWRHVHVIDSAVFPSIPATTMVLTIMANAWRITSQALPAPPPRA